MMLGLSFLVSIATGFLLMRAIWPGGSRVADWLRLPLGILIGLGLSSLVGFGLQVANPPGQSLWIVPDLLLLVVAAGAFLAFGRGGSAAAEESSKVWTPAKWVALAAVVAMCVAYALMALPRQTGEVDAWSIWNMRARFLYRGGTFATMADPLLRWIHPEFPYLISALALRSWHWAGEETTTGPMGIAALFVAALGGGMYGALRLLRSHSQGLLAVVALLGSAGFIGNGAVQYADFPLAAYVFGSLAAILVAERLQMPRVVLAAGLCAGFAAWTKTEGLYYALVLLGIALWRVRTGALAFVVGAVPGVAALAYFKSTIAPAVPATSADPLALLLAVAGKILTFSFLGWVVTPFAVLALYLYCVGVSKQRRHGWIALAALFLGGSLAIIIRDDNIGDAAAIRLILHLWPVALLAVFLHANAPEELTAPVSRKASRK